MDGGGGWLASGTMPVSRGWWHVGRCRITLLSVRGEDTDNTAVHVRSSG